MKCSLVSDAINQYGRRELKFVYESPSVSQNIVTHKPVKKPRVKRTKQLKLFTASIPLDK